VVLMDIQRVAIVDPSDSTRETLRNLLLGLDTVWLEAECSRYEFFADVIAQAKPDMVLVALDSDPMRALQLISQLSSEKPQIPILAVSSRTDGQFILQTLRSGAKEFLTQPLVLEELLTAIQHALSSASGIRSDGSRSSSRQESMVIAIAGSRGGVGCTSLAVNLGCSLAKDKDNNVALIDLDLALGDTDVRLDLIPEYTLADVALNIERVDMTLLRRSLSKHSSGLSLLPHPVLLDDVNLIQEDHLHRVIGLLRATYTHLVLDLSKSFRPIDIAAMKLADVVLMVAQLELTSLRNVVRLLLSFNNMEGLGDKVHVVMNRVGAEQEITMKKAEETMGRQVFWEILNDSKTMLSSRNEGIPLVQCAPNSKVSQSIDALALNLCGKSLTPPPPAKEKKKGFSFF
jgi:pilus assembly protein CpaE